MEKIVLQKYLAQIGFCSRKEAERLLAAQKILVNGRKAEPGVKVNDEDEVQVGKRVIKPKSFSKVYIKMNKPEGYTCTTRQFKGEKNVFELIKKIPGLNVAGRLDKNSRGLLVLSNDGDLINKITHPKYEHEKVYEVKISRTDIDPKFIIDKFLKGVHTNEDGTMFAKHIVQLKSFVYKVILTQGKKRQIRKMFSKIRCHVVDINRVEISGLMLGDLKIGRWTELTDDEIKLFQN